MNQRPEFSSQQSLPLSAELLDSYPYVNNLLEQAVAVLEKAELAIRQATAPSLREQPNPCGECKDCCRGDIISTHQVSPLELALLQNHYGDEVARQFRAYFEHRRDSDGALLHSTCPNYRDQASSEGPRGCKVYPHRPLSCRLFGPYRMQGTVFPVLCTFRGFETEVTEQDYFELPATAKLRETLRDFQLFQRPAQADQAQKVDPIEPTEGTPSKASAHPGQNVGAAAEPTSISDPNLWDGLNPGDPLDQALGWLASQEFAKALACLGPQPPETPAEYEIWASCLSGVGEYAAALHCYQRLLVLVPDREDLLFQAGTSAFMAGDTELARSLWSRSLQSNAAYSPTLAMFGYLSWMSEQWLEAAEYFERAAAADPRQAALAEKARQAREMAKNGPQAHRT